MWEIVTHGYMKKIIKRILILLSILLLLVLCYVAWIIYGTKISNPNNYKAIGDIPAPIGYVRINGSDQAFTKFLRSLPLKSRGEEVQLYTGGPSKHQSFYYAAIDLPLLSNAEQCADACMRLRAEYLFKTGKYSNIHFNDVNGRKLRYSGGASRKAFEKYLKNVYQVASTFSLSREMKKRPLQDIQPGDIFVYAAVDRPGHKIGHAVMVADVAVNKQGKISLLLIEGNTPAQDFHVMRNLLNPFHSPWFSLDEDSDVLILGVFRFKPNELRHF